MTYFPRGKVLSFNNRVYVIHPDFALVREIEEELGSASLLLERFSRGGWQISELVTLTQMMLQSVGETVDYLVLGNCMLRDGLQGYLLFAQLFLGSVISRQEAAA